MAAEACPVCLTPRSPQEGINLQVGAKEVGDAIANGTKGEAGALRLAEIFGGLVSKALGDQIKLFQKAVDSHVDILKRPSLHSLLKYSSGRLIWTV